MTPRQLRQYDLFLDENDWDIYYWATQEPVPTSAEYAKGPGPAAATPVAQGTPPPPRTEEWRRAPVSGEWVQTIGAFKPAYRPVPSRWRGSEILAMIRQHVKDRSAGGVQEVDGKGLAQSFKGSGGGGLGMMPDVRQFDS